METKFCTVPLATVSPAGANPLTGSLKVTRNGIGKVLVGLAEVDVTVAVGAVLSYTAATGRPGVVGAASTARLRLSYVLSPVDETHTRSSRPFASTSKAPATVPLRRVSLSVKKFWMTAPVGPARTVTRGPPRNR